MYISIQAIEFYQKYIEEAEQLVQNIMKARWNMLTNMNEVNRKKFVIYFFLLKSFQKYFIFN
jgi:hypothetical protein